MSSSETEPTEQPTETASTDEPDPIELGAQVDVLTEENQRLRDEYARSKRSQYRRSALALLIIGIVGIAGGLLFPAVRGLLIVLGATGLFGAVLTYYLTPEQFITADIGRGVYSAFAADADALVAELGLQDTLVYVPTPEQVETAACRVFVPQHEAYEVPAASALQSLFVIEGAEATHGLALQPKGHHLFEEFQRTVGRISGDPDRLSAQLGDSLVEQLELCEQVRPNIDAADGRASFGVVGSAFGSIDRFDHPVASVLAVGVAVGLDTPVEMDVAAPEEGRADYLVTVRWAADETNVED